ncbi:MAG: DUF3306 domain-containing protein [Betaproteobacteria bacterium]
MAHGGEEFLSRWSRLKREEAAKTAPESGAQPAAAPASASSAKPVPAAELPPIESLNLESDYRAFLQPGVGADLRKAALTKLFQDPHFHFAQMDRLDTYIDDYSMEDPISEEMMKTLDHARHILFDEKKKPDVAGVAPDEAGPQQENVDPETNADPKQDA